MPKSMPHTYSQLASLDRDTQTKYDIIVSAYLEPICIETCSWRGVGYLLVPKKCPCGANDIKASSIPFKHTGDDWIKITDNFGRWCWYRGVIAPPGSREMTVLADCSMFSSTEAWEVRIGTNIGCYGADGVKYSETSVVNGEIWFPCECSKKV